MRNLVVHLANKSDRHPIRWGSTLVLAALLLALVFLGSGCASTPSGALVLPPPPSVRY